MPIRARRAVCPSNDTEHRLNARIRIRIRVRARAGLAMSTVPCINTCVTKWQLKHSPGRNGTSINMLI